MKFILIKTGLSVVILNSIMPFVGGWLSKESKPVFAAVWVNSELTSRLERFDIEHGTSRLPVLSEVFPVGH